MFDRNAHPMEFNRLLTLSDGVFAIALTLLVLSLEIPPGLTSGEISRALLDQSPMLLAFVISVGIIALFWFSHHELFAEIRRFDPLLMWLNFAYLSLVVLIPFVQQLQGNYPLEPIVYVLFGGVLALLNLLDLALHEIVHRRALLNVQWSHRRYRTEIARGFVLTGGFMLSIPLAFVLVNYTILIWVLLIPIDQMVKRWGLRQPV